MPRTDRIKRLRIILPILAAIVFLFICAWPLYSAWLLNYQKNHSKTRLRAEEVSMAMPGEGAPAQLNITSPEFTGLDNESRPYTITAIRVIQDVQLKPGAPQGKMQLEQPKAKLILDNETKQFVTLTAKTGMYDGQAQTLQLDDLVTLTHSDGYVLHMQDLFVDLKQGLSMTKTPVTGEGPRGSLSGETLELRDKGAHIILHGRSQVILMPEGETTP